MLKRKKNEVVNKQQESYENGKFCYICRQKFEDKYAQDKKYCIVRNHCHYTGEYRGDAHSTFKLKHSIPKKVTIIFHSRSDYDYLLS